MGSRSSVHATGPAVGTVSATSGFSARIKSMGSKSRSANGTLGATTPRTTDGAKDWSAPIERPIASADEYQHYMPPNMPVCPQFLSMYLAECNRSWKIICKGASPKMRELKKDGIVLFYDEFFHRLFQRDPSFNQVFPGIRKRIEILILAMKFMLADKDQSRETVVTRCRNLGHRHRTIPLVRPHHFSTYTSTMIEVMMYWLDTEATPDVGEAWSNLIGFHLKYMLQAYLHDNVDDQEWSQNTSVSVVRPRVTVEAKAKAKAKAQQQNKAAKPKTGFSLLSKTLRTEREER
ncbi:hypothetical protein SPRG_17806 [Saprolegnia parasitica CBS 223.65]|uniref:Globin domain-containing protein n=1 Tax=Saprolegnia parasitica (strain CBS 223.65) TaxID=695850 RepID=A0A067BIZ8_SAPPC|nr:hypothetical protein SPRG_17806 [Saprolegnia parasitica CBS 223.65]KDO16690.1 hypothetical protein SPRG_17806 [Saprolegnia parasitica CBS 223.65]|eukprot:XP_012212601.1 hypothetical protein SPRG_17806 [Saprolegnia parasitica CBS 223.65]